MKPFQDPDWRRLARYLTGESRSDETEEAWIVDDEERARLAEELQRVWDNTGRSVERRDGEAAWQELEERIARAERSKPEARKRPARRAEARAPEALRRCGRGRRARSRWWGGVAVVALVAAVAALAWQGVLPLGSVLGAEKQTFVTEAGQRTVVELSDGTRVRLNAGSKLTLPETFSETKRTVCLEGEGYFEVVRDTTRPFRVHTPRAQIEVKGTAFNVNAYDAGAETHVAVTEGVVALRAAAHTEGRPGAEPAAGAANGRAEVRLEARDAGTVTSEGLQAAQRGIDVGVYTAWTEGRLVFRNAPFEDVVHRLKRWYNLKIDLRMPLEDVGRLNATFEEEPMRVVLGTIAAALGLRYQKTGRRVTFLPGSDAVLLRPHPGPGSTLSVAHP